MRMKTLFRYFMVSLIMIVAVACEYEDYPDPIWDPDATGGATPIITSMDPASVAYDGITMVTITGENFSPVLMQNQITFNGKVAEIDTNLSTQAALVVTTPVVIPDAAEEDFIDNVQVLVAVQGAYEGALYDQPFRIERAVIEWGSFIGEKPDKSPNAVAVDADENVYIAAGADDKILYKVDTAGERTEFGTGLASITRDLKVGPGGGVYFARNNPYVYRVPPEGGEAVRSPRIKSKIACMDFDMDQNMYCGGKNDSLYLYNPTAEAVLGVADADDYIYTTLRVYDGYVYVAGVYDGTDATVTVLEAVWRHEILAGGMLSTRELVYDWTAYAEANTQNILSMVIDMDGIIYLGTSEGDGPAMLTLNAATQELLPFYDAVLTAPATHLSWGTSNFMYVARTMTNSTDELPTGAFRIAHSTESAPYYGRN